MDLYLEGQDQHRGWREPPTSEASALVARFQSSLITSVAVNDRAPYKSAGSLKSI